jgi:tRNA-specific 2-thiouridylase
MLQWIYPTIFVFIKGDLSKMPGNSKKIICAMSGGVDSAVAATLLKEEGYDVVGVMMTLWSDPCTENLCCTSESMDLAKSAADILSIPFHVIDVKDIFYDKVVKYFIESYKNGETPNPCIACNRHVRWNSLFKFADQIGAEFVGSGHYARIRKTKSGSFQLLRGVDEGKDQSYVLYRLTQEQLSRTVFPIGRYLKSEVRTIAKKYDLPMAERSDSQDLCFVGKEGYRDFLMRYSAGAAKSGHIKSTQGEILGEHQGLAFYTIGQRKGLGISASKPVYVLSKSVEDNTIIVGTKDELGRDELTAKDVNWVSGSIPEKPFKAEAKIRYKTSDVPGIVSLLDKSRLHIKFDKSLPDITPGQSVVIYQDEVCIGGGIIL